MHYFLTCLKNQDFLLFSNLGYFFNLANFETKKLFHFCDIFVLKIDIESLLGVTEFLIIPKIKSLKNASIDHLVQSSVFTFSYFKPEKI